LETIRKPPLVKAQTALNKNKNKIKIKYGEKRFSIWRMQCGTIMTLILPGDCTLQCACSSGITTVNSPSGSTLQSDTWLWDDMPWNSPKRPPYWNSTSGYDFDHITAVDMSFCTSLRNFIQIGPPSAEKNDVVSIFNMAGLSHVGF